LVPANDRLIFYLLTVKRYGKTDSVDLPRGEALDAAIISAPSMAFVLML
jgi:hypothetical protein